MPFKNPEDHRQYMALYMRDYRRRERELIKKAKLIFNIQDKSGKQQRPNGLLKNKSAVIKVWSVFFIGIFVCAFVWWVSHQFFLAFQSAGSSMIQTMETNSTRTDLIETFFLNVDTYILFIGLIALGLWVLQRSQKKGELVYET